MGKDDKQRRKGTSASSSRAADLLQSSGLGIQFLNLGGNDPASLEFPSIDENASDEFGDVDGEFRIAFRKLNKREANTREKGLKALLELINNADVNSVLVVNEIRHFVKFYNYLVFDSIHTIRSASNDVLATAILKLRKQIAEHVAKMLPATLISMFDSVSIVRRSATELIDKCFNEEQRAKIYSSVGNKSIKLCLQIVQKKNTLVTKQKYEDVETLQQRSDRIIIQAFTALGELAKKCPEMNEEVLKTINSVYDSIASANSKVFNSMLICILQLISNGQLIPFMRTDASFKILKLLDSEDDVLCKNAFGCYLFMAEAVATSEIDTVFTKKDFIDHLVLRMVKNKGRHFNALQESLLPLVILAIRDQEDNDSFEWIIEVMESFFEGEIDDSLYLVWFKTFIELSDWIYKPFLASHWNEDFAKKLASTTLEFVTQYIERESNLASDLLPTFSKLCAEFIVRRMKSSDEVKLASRLSTLLIDQLPITSSLIGSILDVTKSLPQHEKHFFDLLVSKCFTNYLTPLALFRQLVKSKLYVDNPDLDLKLLAERLINELKNEEFNDVSDYLECYKYLNQNGACDEFGLSKVLDFNKAQNLSSIIKIFGNDTKALSSDERLSLLSSYISSIDNQITDSPWSEEFIRWVENLNQNDVYSLIDISNKHLPLRLHVKLVLSLDSSSIIFEKEQRNLLAESVLKRFFTFDEPIDKEDIAGLDAFLESTSTNLKPFVDSIFEQLKSHNTSDIKKWYSIGSALKGLTFVVNAFEVTADSFDELSRFLDSTFAEEILLNENMLTTIALSSLTHQVSDVNRCQIMIELANTSSFYMAFENGNVPIQLYICLSYAMLKLYTNGLIIQNELTRQFLQFLQYWDDIIQKWDMSKVCERIIYYLVESKKEIPFSILFMLRRLQSEFKLDTLVDIFTISTLSDKQKLRAISSLTYNLPPELLADSDYFHFINSLEKTSQKLSDGQDEQIEIGMITLADLKNKIEADDFDGLFCVSEQDPIKSALSCAVFRLCTHICKILPEIESSIRDFLVCGLITAAENFSTNARCQGPIRLLATFASKFFILYDDSLTKILSILNSSAISSDEVVERRSKIESIKHEWREFFGASMANYLMAWFCWTSFTESKENESFPEFFRIQICKYIYNADTTLGLFKFIHSPASVLFGQIGVKSDVGTKDLFDMLVELLFSHHSELQLVAVQILQSELITILCAKKDTMDENTQIIMALQESTEVEESNLEYKLLDFFTSLLGRLQTTEWTNINTIDPWLIVADLLLRIIRLLDSQTAAAFCSKLEGDAIHSMLFRICSYINFNENPNLVKKFAVLDPAGFFTLWKNDFDVRDKEAYVERLIAIEGYSCWLYQRALTTLPAVVREWFSKVKDNRLKAYTQKNISPILTKNEMDSIGDQSKRGDGFSMRARPNASEIFVKYKIDEAVLELTLNLPEDYPLSSAIIHHDNRQKLLVTGLTKTLHKNLFAFVNTRNGSLLEGIDQWRRNVEKQVEGVEPCSICLMIVSSSEYKLPSLRCRTCKQRFHSDCMLKWIRTSAKPNCPLCRAEFN